MKKPEELMMAALDVICIALDNTVLLAFLAVWGFNDVGSMSAEAKAVLWGMLFIILAIDRSRRASASGASDADRG